MGKASRWIAIGLTTIFLLAPPIVTLMMSLEPGDTMIFPTSGVSLRWYEFFLTRRSLMAGLGTSLLLASLATLLTLAAGVPCAYALTRYDLRGKQFLSTLFVSPLSLPGVVFGVSLLTIFNMTGFHFTFAKLLIAHTILCIPYVLRTTMAALIGIDRSLEDAAKNLGANELQTFSKITLPLIRPGLIAGAIFAFATSFDDVAVSVFLTDYTTSTLPVTLFAFMKSMFSPGIAAVSSVLLILTFVVVVLIEKTTGLDKFTGL